MNARELAKDFRVPETKDGISELVEIGGTTTIIVLVIDMLTAIGLDDQHPIAAEEIYDKGIDGRLADEFQLRHRAVAKQIPQTLLGFSRGLA